MLFGQTSPPMSLADWLALVIIGVGFFGFILMLGFLINFIQSLFPPRGAYYKLKRHFFPVTLDKIVLSDRQYPSLLRADLPLAISEFASQQPNHVFYGLKLSDNGFGGTSFTTLLEKGDRSDNLSAPQYEQIDVGEDEPITCLKNGLWLIQRGQEKIAVLYAINRDFGNCGVELRMRVEVARATHGAALEKEFRHYLDDATAKSKFYRGKVLSFEGGGSYEGNAGAVKVHRLSTVERNDVILPQATLDLLDRNVIHFVRLREKMERFKLSSKKGLLFYGPPGTGKTHTIRYLASELKGHTVLLITAEQISMLSEYMILARLLQPSIVVLEDVDLIARSRERHQGGGSELILNRLLNEMDGLQENANVLFLLTTNRPEELESALAARPGRIDQAIEFPLPDAECRAKLVRHYAQDSQLNPDLVEQIVKKTEKVTASFIKELIRRSVQNQVERDEQSSLEAEDITLALEEMLFSGGSLNLKLLGAAGRISPEAENN